MFVGLLSLAAAAYFIGDAVTMPARERRTSVRRAAQYGDFKPGLAIAGVFLGILFGGAAASAGGVLFASVAFAGIGFIAPDFFVSSKARTRKERIRAELP